MRFPFLPALLLTPALLSATEQQPKPTTPAVRVGASAVELEADDDMVIGGSIMPGHVKGQDGKLRAVATAIEKPGSGKVVIVACDVLMLNRDLPDPVVAGGGPAAGMPPANAPL